MNAQISLESLLVLSGLFLFMALIFIFRFKGQLQEARWQLREQNTRLESIDALQERYALLEREHGQLQPLIGVAAQLEKQLADLQSLLQSKEAQLTQTQDKLTQLREQNAQLQQTLEHEKSRAQEKIELLEHAKQQLANEFKLLANQIFEAKQAQFHEQGKQSMEAVVKPMQAALESFKQRVETVHKEDLEGRASLGEQLKQLQSLNAKMSEEAHNLTQALKGDSKTQGNWGELVLERLLERSGLREGMEFEREKSFVDENGKRLRPDVIINLPDNKHIIVDSKVSLLHYEKALNSDSEAARQQALKQHLASLKNHIETLAAKRYEHLERLNAPDFVLMFVPVEGAYMLAIESDPAIFEHAFEKRVAVVTPTTLFTTLKTVEQLWRYERQSENTVKLIKRAAEVHDKFVGFVETFEKVGKQLETLHGSYHTARKQMLDGSGNLVRQAEMLKELAGKTKKEIPPHLLEEAGGISGALSDSNP